MSTSYGRHNKFQKDVMLQLQKMYPQARIWPNHTGAAYEMGSVKRLVKAAMSLNVQSIKDAVRSLSMLKYGKVGSADVTGICPSGVRLEIEIKTGAGAQKHDQKVFQRVIEDCNGIYKVITNTREIQEQLIEIGEIANFHVGTRSSMI